MNTIITQQNKEMYHASKQVIDKAWHYFLNGHVKDLANGTYLVAGSTGEHIVKRLYEKVEGKVGIFVVYYTCTCEFGLKVTDKYHFCSHMMSVHLKLMYKFRKTNDEKVVKFSVFKKVNRFKMKKGEQKERERLVSFSLYQPTV